MTTTATSMLLEFSPLNVVTHKSSNFVVSPRVEPGKRGLVSGGQDVVGHNERGG
jgi:hypothetical protein